MTTHSDIDRGPLDCHYRRLCLSAFFHHCPTCVSAISQHVREHLGFARVLLLTATIPLGNSFSLNELAQDLCGDIRLIVIIVNKRILVHQVFNHFLMALNETVFLLNSIIVVQSLNAVPDVTVIRLDLCHYHFLLRPELQEDPDEAGLRHQVCVASDDPGNQAFPSYIMSSL